MSVYYIRVSKVVSDIFEIESENEQEAIKKLRSAIDNKEVCTDFFNNTEYIFDIIDDISKIKNNITQI